MKQYNITVKGVTYEVLVEEVPVGSSAAPAAHHAPADAPSPTHAGFPGGTDDTLLAVKSPMPGTVLSVSVNPGMRVRNGDVLCTLEAMKMENDIAAPRDGIVEAVYANKGAAVESGEVLFTLR